MEKEKETSNKPKFINEKWKKFKEFLKDKFQNFKKELNLSKYYNELKKKVDIYFVIIISILLSLAIFMISELNKDIKQNLNLIIILISICLFIYLFSIRTDLKSNKITILDKVIVTTIIFFVILFILLLGTNIIHNSNISLVYSPSGSNLLIYSLNEEYGLSLIKFLLLYNYYLPYLILLVILLVILFYRIFKYSKSDKIAPKYMIIKKQHKQGENREKIVTLKYISDLKPENNDYEKLKKDIDKIRIRDCDDDIPEVFEFTRTKEELKNTILNNKDNTDYSSIGIVGEWGIGKSTIINLTIKELDKNTFILIRDFDPWAIKSQDALILAMYNTIMENLGENIGYFKRKKIQNALINISTNIPYIGKGIGGFFENRIDDYTEYKEIKADLEEKLENSDKRIVFIIDNLDRMNSNNVLFLLTLIETLFKLPNITYILAYDKKRLNEIFEDNRIDLRYLEKIINTEIFMPVLDRNILEICLINLLNFYNYNFNSHDEIIKSICKRFTNIRQFIHFLNSLSKIPNDFNDLKNNLEKPLGVEYDYIVIQSIKFFDYVMYLEIYKDSDLLLEIMEQKEIPASIYNKYKEYSDLLEITFSNAENTRDTILNSTLFKMCFLDINKTIEDALELLILFKKIRRYNKKSKKCPKKFKKFNKKIIKKQPIEDARLKTLCKYLNLNRFASKSDIMLALSPFEIISYFKNIDFKTRELLWNLFAKCTSHHGNPLLINPSEEIKNVADIEIKKILQGIFYNFNKDELTEFTQNQLNLFDNNKEEYCKKLFIYDLVFENENNKNFKEFIRKLYQPVFDEPMFLWEKNKSDKFYSNLKNHLNLDETKTLDYATRLYKKIEKDGQHLYEYIEFFNNKEIFKYYDDVKDNKTVLTIENIFKLIKKYPPKNKEEEEIYKNFEFYDIFFGLNLLDIKKE